MAIHENWVHETMRESANKDREKLKSIHCPEVSEYKYRVHVGSSIHFTNNKKRYKELLVLAEEFKQRYRG
jgi:hypothetical protein